MASLTTATHSGTCSSPDFLRKAARALTGFCWFMSWTVTPGILRPARCQPEERHKLSFGVVESNSDIFGMVTDGHAFSRALIRCWVRMETSWWTVHTLYCAHGMCAEGQPGVVLRAGTSCDFSAHLACKRAPHWWETAVKFCDRSRWQ
ncbi:hypothetical protein mRhiFer1_009808 [Rhinolophus ferrumequinum]|uniref:Uncharacterized protein n=1 Tax=Rhinolophus ferrumequinum TaxID=59479 RepID=A0A7J7YS66_RHIFE|nr:hypothetical protein mRhiFer1_009808 [Rhinolophus ferrumequinum]